MKRRPSPGHPHEHTALFESEKRCSKCGFLKPESDFPKNPKSHLGINSVCKACVNKWSSNHHKTDPERRQKHTTHTWNWKVKYRYKTTPEALEQMLRDQGGVCAICRRKKDEKLNVDHCHKTGKIRGLLCAHCNRAIGLFYEDVQVMRLAIDYLEVHNVSA